MRNIELTGLVGNEVIFTDGSGINQLDPNLPHNFVDIVSLDAQGEPVTPGAGTYTITVQDFREGGFKTVADGGTVTAAETGGTTLVDGVQCSASFRANPLSVKVVPAGVTVAVSYRVSIRQNLT